MGTASHDVTLVQLREAIEASWGPDTAYFHVSQEGNPALGNCYPTSRVVQHFFPETEIVEGQVWTGEKMDKHFWNIIKINGHEMHIDLTWQQFPHGSVVKEYKLRDRESLGDREESITRVALLMKRVDNYLNQKA